MAGNLALAILITGGGLALAWTGVQDPEGGLTGQIGRVLRGEPPAPKRGGATGVWQSGEEFGRAATLVAINTIGTSGGGTDTTETGGRLVGTTLASTTGGGTRGAVIAEARRHLGKPYVWGAKGPSSFDCSGLVQYVYSRAAGLSIPAPSQIQATRGRAVSRSSAQPGDLVCYGVPAWHIGIYVGGGQLLHAANPRKGVVVESVDWNGGHYYRNVLG